MAKEIYTCKVIEGLRLCGFVAEKKFLSHQLWLQDLGPIFAFLIFVSIVSMINIMSKVVWFDDLKKNGKTFGLLLLNCFCASMLWLYSYVEFTS